eukprot:1157909-Pelagomonas_calceolata.AAC.1
MPLVQAVKALPRQSREGVTEGHGIKQMARLYTWRHTMLLHRWLCYTLPMTHRITSSIANMLHEAALPSCSVGRGCRKPPLANTEIEDDKGKGPSFKTPETAIATQQTDFKDSKGPTVKAPDYLPWTNPGSEDIRCKGPSFETPDW